ncbi:MAG TPA: hypothetical protein VMV52_07780 [Candidatus Nanopelagicaceae bacterium]|nr:hypothetical protein [Candidatus Nanopelagicaceae bacterium]
MRQVLVEVLSHAAAKPEQTVEQCIVKEIRGSKIGLVLTVLQETHHHTGAFQYLHCPC